MRAVGEPKLSSGFGNSWQALSLVRPFFKQYRWQLFIGFLSLLAVNGRNNFV